MSVSEIFEKWKNRRARESELRSLDMSLREELARDVGLAEGDFEHLFVAGPWSTEQLDRLMGALSLDIDGIANFGAIERDLRVICSGCRAVDRCRHELDEGSAARNYGEYCPNALTFESLLEAEAQSMLAARNRNRQI